MNHPALMGVSHGPRQQENESRRLARLQAAEAGRFQAGPLDQLQSQVEATLVFADLEDLHDVGVVQGGQRLGLAAEAGQLLRPGVGRREQHLERHHAAQCQVMGLVNHPHAAAA